MEDETSSPGVLSCLGQLREKPVDLLGCHADQHLPVVVQDDRRVAARTEALALLQGELAVRRGLTPIDAELFFQMTCSLVCTRQRARQVRADAQLVLADRSEVVHRIEARDLVYRH